MDRSDFKRDKIPEGDIVQGLVTYREESRAFQIQTCDNPQFTYDIELDRLMTHRQFTDWMWQLQFKDWITGQHFRDFLDCLCMVIRRDWQQWPQKFYEVTQAIQDDLDSP